MSIRIDTHQHFWTLARDDYGWLTPELKTLYRDYGPADLSPLLAAAGIDKTVLVQAAASVDETRYLLDLAERHDFIAGVVGWIDMKGGFDSVEILSVLGEHPKFLGIRPMVQDIEDRDWLLKPTLATVFDAVIKLGLRFDALVKPLHLPNLLTLLKRYPELRAVINHGAKPDIANESWQPWAEQVSRLADETAAYCKLSGLITETGNTQSYRDVEPYADHLLASFGEDRLMWGSDWPVLNLRGNYRQWHSEFRRWARPLDTAARAKIEGGNAAIFYGLQV